MFIYQHHIPWLVPQESKLSKFFIDTINHFYQGAIFHANNPQPTLTIPTYKENVNSVNPLDEYNISLEPEYKEFIDAALGKFSIKQDNSYFLCKTAALIR